MPLQGVHLEVRDHPVVQRERERETELLWLPIFIHEQRTRLLFTDARKGQHQLLLQPSYSEALQGSASRHCS
eukprot:440416-Pyramimonas_sp.AAC.1